MPMPLPIFEIAAQIATIFSAIASAAQLRISYKEALKRVDDNIVDIQARVLVSTYSDDELQAIHRRISSCRDRFIAEGDGKARVSCMCQVLKDAIDGNGGSAPLPEWEEMFKKLCAPR
jgi:hypothetical protein